jgi:hypothetical protein
MEVADNKLLDYLDQILGERPALSEAPGLSAKLPLFLRSKYQLFTMQLLGRKCLIAIEAEDRKGESPAEYWNDAKALKLKLGEDVILVPHALPSYARNRLARQGIPFIVPGTQMFLPFLLTDLRERFRRPRSPVGKGLTPTAQLLVLFHLQRERLDYLPLQDIAQRLGYSAMTITNVKDELESAKVCKVLRQGRTLTLQFPEFKRALWNLAEPLMSSPVKKAFWVVWKHPVYPALTAGLTALSKRSMIEDDRWPTFALFQATFLSNLEKGLYRSSPSPEENSVRLEAWTYNPLLLGDQETVDRLSLYLSLRDSPDERVQKQLEELIEGAAW